MCWSEYFWFHRFWPTTCHHLWRTYDWLPFHQTDTLLFPSLSIGSKVGALFKTVNLNSETSIKKSAKEPMVWTPSKTATQVAPVSPVSRIPPRGVALSPTVLFTIYPQRGSKLSTLLCVLFSLRTLLSLENIQRLWPQMASGSPPPRWHQPSEAAASLS